MRYVETVLRRIFSLKLVSNAFLACVDVKASGFRSEKMVLASRSNFRGDILNASAVALGVPAMISTRSSSLPIFSRVTCPSTVRECFTPSGS